MTRPGRHSQHVVRMAALFVVGVGAFFVLRAAHVPADFGVFGHYRAGAIDLNRNKPLVHAGREACADCHADVIEVRTGGAHARIGCEACHGAAGRHASGDDQAPAPSKIDPRQGCLNCHARDASRPASHPQVTAADHAPDGPCSACHQPHNPKVS